MTMQKNKEGTDEKSQGKYTCVYCETPLRRDQVYNSRNRLLGKNYTLCRACACREANDNDEDLHRVLMILDIPFFPDIYKQCKEDQNPFSAYMLRVNNPKKKYVDGRSFMELHYCDSPTWNIVNNVGKYEEITEDFMLQLKNLFGSWWNKEQLIAMNKELDKMFIQYGGDRDDMPKVELYCEIITLKWLSREKYANGDTKSGRELSESRQRLLKDNKMNVQALRDKKDNDSIGERIDWVEYEPILPSKKYHDIDGIMFMFDKLIEQLLRFVGVNKKPVEEDAKEMIEYVENHPDYCKDME